ncbi:MAG: ATP-dependent transcriptional regulator, MalT-like, LuxR family [Pseudonocardiales bacterium]|nr:ATP-dependent transcriptional regulator, MalT-like, LuxR family [Pseudonocardiales bacterium]
MPRTPRQVLRRPALEQRLDAWAPLTVIHAPQGYGKTTLLATWLERQPPAQVRTLWLATTHDLADREPFVGHLVRRLRAAGLAPPAGSAPGGSLVDLDEVLLEIDDDRRVALVVDDMHHVSDITLLADLVSLVQRHDNLHLFVCSRRRHPIEALAVGAVETAVIGPDAVMFTVEEIVELARIMGKSVGVEEASGIHAAIGGWTSAVRLAIAAYDDDELGLSAARDYLRDTVVPTIADEATLQQLMRFSLAADLDSQLIRDLADDPDPERLLASLQAPGVLSRHQDGSRIVVTMPSLIRDILRESFTARAPAAAAAMHCRLARWYSRHGRRSHDNVTAIEHAVAGEDWPLVYEIWSAHGMTLALRHADRLCAALGAIPEKVIAGYPGLQVALLTMTVEARDSDLDGRSATIRVYVENSRRVFTAEADALSLPDLLYTGTGHVIGLRVSGRFSESATFATELEELAAPLISSGHSIDDRLAWFHVQRGLTQTLIGDDHAAVRCYQQAWNYRSGSEADFIPSNAAANLAMTYALDGRRQMGQLWLDRYSRFDTEGTWADYLVGIGARVATGLFALDRLDGKAAHVELDHLGEGSVAVELWPFVAYLHAQHGLHFADPAATLSILESAQSAHDFQFSSRGVAATLLTRARADLLIACGHGQRALQVIGTDGGSALLAVPLARIHLLAGDYVRARTVAGDAAWNRVVPARVRLDLLTIAATAALRMHDDDAARRLAGSAFDLYRESQSLLAFAGISAADRAALLDLAGQRLDPDAEQALAQLRAVYPDRLHLITLTGRERAVLQALLESTSRQDIAEMLQVSLNTIKSQLNSLYRKLGTTTREQTLAKLGDLGDLRDLGLIDRGRGFEPR